MLGLEMFINLPGGCVVAVRMSWERDLLGVMQAGCRWMGSRGGRLGGSIMSVFLTLSSPGTRGACRGGGGPGGPVALGMVAGAVAGVASGRAAGPSGIVAEMLKPVGEAGAGEVHDLVEKVISEGCIPAGWQEASLSICTRVKGML